MLLLVLLSFSRVILSLVNFPGAYCVIGSHYFVFMLVPDDLNGDLFLSIFFVVVLVMLLIFSFNFRVRLSGGQEVTDRSLVLCSPV